MAEGLLIPRRINGTQIRAQEQTKRLFKRFPDGGLVKSCELSFKAHPVYLFNGVMDKLTEEGLSSMCRLKVVLTKELVPARTRLIHLDVICKIVATHWK